MSSGSIGWFADGIDSGDRREGSSVPQTTPTATDPQGGIAGDFNNYQQNCSAIGNPSDPSSMPVLWFGFQIFTASASNPIIATSYTNGYCNSPLDTVFCMFSSDLSGTNEIPGNFYSPIANNTAFSSSAKGHVYNISGAGTVYPALNGLSPGTYYFAMAVQSPAAITATFSRLIPKGNYNVVLGRGYSWSATITGFSANVYWCTSQGDNLFLTINDDGTTTPSFPISLSITEPWAYIKYVFTGVGNHIGSSGNWQQTIMFDPCIYKQPLSTIQPPGPAVTCYFTIAAQGYSTLSYQWSYSTDGGSTWTNITSHSSPLFAFGYTTDQLSIFIQNNSFNGYQFRCAVTDTNGIMTSNAAILTT